VTWRSASAASMCWRTSRGSFYTKRIRGFSAWPRVELVIDTNLKGTFLMWSRGGADHAETKKRRILNTGRTTASPVQALRALIPPLKRHHLLHQRAWLGACSDGFASTPSRRPTDTPRVMEKRLPKHAATLGIRRSRSDATGRPEDLAELYYFLTTPRERGDYRQLFHCNGGLASGKENSPHKHRSQR